MRTPQSVQPTLAICGGVCLGLLLAAAPPVPLAATVPAMPMPIPESESAAARWLTKPVLASLVLDTMESPTNWTHHGFGEMSLTPERAHDGLQSIRLVSPTESDQPGPKTGRPFGEAELRRSFNGEDWRDYNRLSVWVYPTLPGFKVISLLLKLHNDGSVKVPDQYGREGLDYVLVKPDQWNHVVWEIPHLARDKVTGLSVIYRLQGNEPGATNRVCFDFDHLELQRVKPDYFEGWSVAPGRVAYSHTGYALGAEKTAIASGLAATRFEILRQDSGQVVLSKPIRSMRTDLGSFQLLDFSEIREPGDYLIHVGDVLKGPFPISNDVWRRTVWEAINFFFCERCGFEVPGIHSVCHADWQATHDGRELIINGGWHDAGDLSQGCVNTAEATYAMLNLADKLAPTQPSGGSVAVAKRQTQPVAADEDAVLAQRLQEEAQWGLAWLLKTRFGDGYRVTWATMDYWTDGRLGTPDDTQGEARNTPFENFLAATAEARASQSLKHTNSQLALEALRAAKEDWQFAQDKTSSPSLELASAAALASLELFKVTGQANYAEAAIAYAEPIMQCQQVEFADWSVPLNGFFYTTPKHERRLHYSHRGHEQAPIVALTELCAAFPTHAAWMRWYATVLLHSEYLHTIAQYTAPYGLLPAGVYDLNESAAPWFQLQVLNGVPLGPQVFLRRFPVWTSFRGNHGTVLSQTKALSAAARLRRNLDLANLAQAQLEWVVGRNPFAQSTMYGVGHDFAPQYTAMSGDMVGSLPVGIQTRASEDRPYWPAANCYNYKEVWVHPASRWLWLMPDLNGPAKVCGQVQPQLNKPVEFREVRSGQLFSVPLERRRAQFTTWLPQGQYTVRQGARQQSLTLLPGMETQLDLRQGLVCELSQQTTRDGRLTLQLKATGTGMHWITLRTHNLTLDSPAQQLFTLAADRPQIVRWQAKINAANQTWIALAIPDNDLGRRQEIFGSLRGR